MKKKNLQQYLNIDKKHSNKEIKVKVEEITVDGFNPLDKIEGGKLKLSGYLNLKKVKIEGHNSFLKTPLTELEIADCPNLTSLDCSWNKISSLTITNCPQLKKLDCTENLLTDLNFLEELNTENLTQLHLGNNNFFEQGLTCFQKFVELEDLYIGTAEEENYEEEEKIEKGVYNRFFGSLEPLKSMNKLKILDIVDTRIDSGLEYLPISLEEIYCCCYNWENSIEKELSHYRKTDENENFIDLLKLWRKDNFQLIIKVWQQEAKNFEKKAKELEEELRVEREEVGKALQKAQEWRERQLKEITERKDKKIEELEQQSVKLQMQIQILSK